jgi:hypothetical protein
MLPLLVATLASVDPDHHVAIAGAGADTEVVLSHDVGPAGSRCSPDHHHDALSRALVFFSQPATGQPDHVLHFSSGGEFLEQEAVAVSAPVSPAVAPVFQLRSIVFDPLVALRAIDPCPPAPPGALCGICAVVLLI